MVRIVPTTLFVTETPNPESGVVLCGHVFVVSFNLELNLLLYIM